MTSGVLVPDELVPQNDGNFGVVRDTYLIGGWRVVGNHVARDA